MMEMIFHVQWSFILLLLSSGYMVSSAADPPHIIIIVADDLVSFSMYCILLVVLSRQFCELEACILPLSLT